MEQIEIITTNESPLRIRQIKSINGYAPNSFYCVLTSDPRICGFGTTKKELVNRGLTFVLQNSDPLRDSVIYHHKLTGSTIHVRSDYERDVIDIYGDRKSEAKNDMGALAKSKEFILEEIPYAHWY